LKEFFAGSLKLTRFMLRRERVTSVVWIVILVFFSAGLIPLLTNMFGDDAERAALITTLESPAMRAFMGPLFDGGDTFAGLYSAMLLLWMLITIGIMNIFLMTRHTRADEERNRTEVVRSLPVGRLSILNAAVLTAIAVNAVIAIVSGICILAVGAEHGMDFEGSMLYGAAMGVFGLFMAAVTAVFCQLCVSSRGAIGFSFLFLMIAYMVRIMGDMNVEDSGSIPIMTALSPIGLLLHARTFVSNDWLPVLAVLAITAVAVAIAFALNRVRDIDQGFISARPGRTEAKKGLLSPLGLSWRLLRNPLIAWVFGLFAIAVSYGAILGDIETFLESNEIYYTLMVIDPDISLAENFASTIIVMLAICCVIPVLIASLKLRSEEKDGRIEHVLSRSVSRVRYFGGYTFLAFAVSVAATFASALGLYASAVSVMDTPISFSFCFNATMIYLPALWVIIGLAVLLVGLIPRATFICWAMMGYSLFTLFFGRMIPSLSGWIGKTTPFGYIPLLPRDSVNWLALGALTLIAACLTAIGLFAYKKRDMTA